MVLFGYVTFYKDELKIKDYNKFKAYYCGLCKELGKRFNQLVRLGLSYDFTFLALLLDSVDDIQTEFSQEGCFKHIGKKRVTVKKNPHVQYAADMSVVFMYFKLLDDIHDDFSLKSAVAIVPYWFAVRKVKRKYPKIVETVRSNLKTLSALENKNCASVDEVAHTFAGIMEVLFDKDDENLKRLGYNIGRFIYIADAANDFESDVKKNKYNPFKYAYPDKNVDEIKLTAGQSMLFTLAMAGQNYESLNIIKNKDLLDNIIYLGLRHRMDMILCTKACEKRGKTDGKSV
ncbi:MAG: hypothetical protein IJN62_01210 [Clostridia bacterium]|nr:hypothetical protein [Clostridia bacterium]